MAPRRLSTTSRSALMQHLFGPQEADAATDPLARDLNAWMATLPRFHAFVDAHRDKVRKKLRLARDPDARSDLRAELLVARRLLGDRHLDLSFEPTAARKGGPDYTVTYRAGSEFNLEVTRPRRAATPAELARPISAKLLQLPAGRANVLLLALAPTWAASHADIGHVMHDLRARADANDDAYFTATRVEGARDFRQRLPRLSAVLAFSEADDSEASASAWTNPSARIAVPDRALRACLQALLY